MGTQSECAACGMSDSKSMWEEGENVHTLATSWHFTTLESN